MFPLTAGPLSKVGQTATTRTEPDKYGQTAESHIETTRKIWTDDSHTITYPDKYGQTALTRGHNKGNMNI
jgi:hypothetical protein